jgi:cold shock CspA family protein
MCIPCDHSPDILPSRLSPQSPPAHPLPPSSNMAERATVKWFDSKKGFGFATPAKGGSDIFVHHTHIETVSGRPVLEENDEIAYDLGEHNSRPTATKVTMADGSAVSGMRRRAGGGRNKRADGEDGKPEGGDAQPSESATDGAAADGKPRRQGSGKGGGKGGGKGEGKKGGKGGRGGESGDQAPEGGEGGKKGGKGGRNRPRRSGGKGGSDAAPAAAAESSGPDQTEA